MCFPCCEKIALSCAPIAWPTNPASSDRSRTDSDVDADILAEYVVALLQHDTSSADARQMCRSELYDFLKDGRHFPCTVWCWCWIIS